MSEPSKILPRLTFGLSLMCSFNDTEDDIIAADSITLMTAQGAQIASITGHTAAKVLNGESNVKVAGDLTASSELKGFHRYYKKSKTLRNYAPWIMEVLK